MALNSSTLRGAAETAGNIAAVHFGLKLLVEHDHHAVYLEHELLDKAAVPLLERLLHDGVVGVVEHFLCDPESLCEAPALFLHDYPDELRQNDNGVRVVHLNAVVFCEVLHCAEHCPVLSDKVSDCGCGEEILLLQTEYLAGFGLIVGVEDTGDVLGGTLLFTCLGEPALVKEAEIELIVSFCLPQTQRADIFSSVAYHGVVVGNCVHIAVSVVYHNGFLLPADAPGVAVLLPVVGGLSLEAVLYALLEQTILVTDTVAVQGEVQRSGAVKEACCEPAKAAVSEGCVLDLFKFGDISLPLKFSLSILLLLSDAALQT